MLYESVMIQQIIDGFVFDWSINDSIEFNFGFSVNWVRVRVSQRIKFGFGSSDDWDEYDGNWSRIINLRFEFEITEIENLINFDRDVWSWDCMWCLIVEYMTWRW